MDFNYINPLMRKKILKALAIMILIFHLGQHTLLVLVVFEARPYSTFFMLLGMFVSFLACGLAFNEIADKK